MGPWKDVPIAWRDLYSIASVLKAAVAYGQKNMMNFVKVFLFLFLIEDNPKDLSLILPPLDKGLLMGGPHLHLLITKLISYVNNEKVSIFFKELMPSSSVSKGE